MGEERVIRQRRQNILALEIIKVSKDLFRGHAARQPLQHVYTG